MTSLFDPQSSVTGTVYNDGATVELGVRFVSSAGGSITELRYWRAAGDAGDTDQRVGRIWNENGTIIGSVTFVSAPGEIGWQTAVFETAVEIDANVTYTVSYRTDDNYIATADFFATDHTNSSGYLTAPSGQNGVYAYGSAVTLPTQSYRQTNYWIDVGFSLGNQLPQADPETATVLEDGSVVIDVVAGDTDAEDGVPDPTTVRIENADNAGGKLKTVAGQGVWSVNLTSGAITFTPTPDYDGPVTPIAYTIADSEGLRSAPASVSVTITPVNDAPVADPETATVPESGSVVIDVVAGDTDVEDGVPDPTTVRIEAADNAGGTVKTVAGQGVWSVNPASGAITFTPTPGYEGPVTPIAYTIADSEGLRSAPASVSVTITGANDAPVADPETATVLEDGSVVIDVVAGDTDAEDGVPDPTTVRIEAADNAGGTVKTVAGQGVWSVNPASGAITFTPTPDYDGPVTPIAYTIADSGGLRSAPASVSVTITPVNDAPVAVADTSTVSQNGATAINVVANDTDVEDGAPDPTTVRIEAADNAGGTVKTVAGQGVWSVNPTSGVVTFTPEQDYGGPVTPVAYTIADSEGLRSAPASLSVEISGETATGLFDPQSSVTGTVYNDGATVELGVRFVSSAGGSITELRYWRAAGDAGDTDQRVGRIWNENGTIIGSVTFVSAPGEIGWQTAVFETAVEIDANVTYTVSYRTDDNYIATADFFATDHTNSSGYLTAPSGQNGVYAYGSAVTLPTQSYRQTNYWIDVGFSLGNQLPQADPETATVLEDGSVVIDVVAGDTDAEDGVPDPTTVRIENADNAGGKLKTVAGQGVWSVNLTSGAITFTPTPDYDGPVTPIAYTIADSEGLRSAPASVSVTITPVNDAPVADPETATVPESGSVVIDVVAGDTDVEDGVPDPTTVRIEAADNAGGTVKTVAGQGVWSVNPASGAITFTPTPGYEGPVTPIAYTIADSEGLRSAPASVSVTITGANDAPVADPETATVLEDGSVVIDVVAGDTDAEDGVPDPTTVRIEAADNAGGTVKTVAGQGVWTVNPASGAITFTPTPDYDGPVTPIAYTIADSGGLRSAPASVSVTITPVNDAPVAVADTSTVSQNGATAINVVANDTDVEDGAPDPTTVRIEAADNAGGTVKTVAGQGVWSVNPTSGVVTFTPEQDYGGPVTPVAYTIADSEGLRSAPASLSVEISGNQTQLIVLENLKEGTPQSYWDVPHTSQIEGFATDISINAGGRVDFKINVNGGAGSDYLVEVFRLGYYGGDGAHKVAEWVNTNATVQPDAQYDSVRGLVDAGNWSVTDSWQSPGDAVSGVYLARLQRLDSNGQPIGAAVNQIPFILRDDDRAADIVLQTSDTTWHAYNGWFGNNGELGANFYGDVSGTVNHPDIPGAGSFAQDRAYAVSYNRPLVTRGIEGQQGGPLGAQDYLFGADYAAIQWLEQNGYDVAYMSGVDTDRLGADYLKKYNAFISVGHDEYWSAEQRYNVEEARDSGVNLLFWGGNDIYWKTRWETSIVDGIEYRTLVCYKETWAHADPNARPEDYYNLDPTNIWTGTWRDDRFIGNPLAGDLADRPPLTGQPHLCNCAENSLTGQLFGPDGTGEFGGALDVPAEFAPLRVWRDTSVANGGALNMSEGILGYEWNTSPQDDFRPAGLIKLSETTIPWSAILVDDGNVTAPGTATHNLSLYRAESGALVFGSGTVFWSWALSNAHDSQPYGGNIENTDLQQFVVNLFADMGIQPEVADAVLASQGLVRATASTDTVAAITTMINLPETVSAYVPLALSGTASESGGVIGAVEVSLDGGTTWKIANGKANWSYDWTPVEAGIYEVMVRAIDDSLNMPTGNSIARDTVEVTPPQVPTAFSLFDPYEVVEGRMLNDGASLSIGVRFEAAEDGQITELKYWRAPGDSTDTDVRTGRLWSENGSLLATVSFTSAPGESGWQVAELATPVQISANTQYVASYFTDDNYFSAEYFFVGEDYTDPFDMLTATGTGNGVYAYGNEGVLPTQTWHGENYWVDVSFEAGPVDAPSEAIASRGIVSSNTFVVAPETADVARVVAYDPEVSEFDYSIVGGRSRGRFTIDEDTGDLSFKSPPGKGSAAQPERVFNLVVRATDGETTFDQPVTVRVPGREGLGPPGYNAEVETPFDYGEIPSLVDSDTFLF